MLLTVLNDKKKYKNICKLRKPRDFLYANEESVQSESDDKLGFLAIKE